MRLVPAALLALLLVALLPLACSKEPTASDDAPSGEAPAAAASDLEIEVLREGSGRSPKATDVVKVHYHGTFPDGKVFDSSVDRGEPAAFPLDGVIPCWTQAVQTMQEGGKIRVTCPPHLAYGARGAGPIPPNSTLVFEVELLGVQ
ncbi:MAG: peptidylprolyl isomerase [Deltaproteobacteria bacterium]|jgi:FKBP-type peptidyl-prolyl cis-trans isomerase FkpA|nr:peptidylprolyl isomerase [Deltaproteobacteria bacterium]